MFSIIATAVLWILALPIYLIRGLFRLIRLQHFWSLAYRARVQCGTCGQTISLVGIWQCRCGFTYRGHLLRECPVCHTVPRMARCFSCGTTRILPEP